LRVIAIATLIAAVGVSVAQAGIRVENSGDDGLDLVVRIDEISDVLGGEGDWLGLRIPGFVPLLADSPGIWLPVKTVLVGAPPESQISYEITDVTTYEIERYVSQTFLERLDGINLLPDEPASIVRDGFYRHQRIVAVRLTPLVIDSGTGRLRVYTAYRVRIRFSQQARSWQRPAVSDPYSESFLSPALLNGGEARKWLKAWSPLRQEGDYFTSSPDWIKIAVDSTGIYCLTGSDLRKLGVELTDIDASSLRLYTGGGLPLSESLADTNPSWMEQVPLKVCDGGDGRIDDSDSLIFYGLSWRDWADLFDPALRHDRFYKSFYSSYNCYWLTWGGDFDEPPKHIDVRDLPQCSNCSYYEPQSFDERIHLERDLFEMFSVRAEDGWYWYALRPGSPFSNTFETPSPDVSTPARLRIRVASWAQGECIGEYYRLECRLNGTRFLDSTWSASLIDRTIMDLETPVTLSSTGLQEIQIEVKTSLGYPFAPAGVCDRLLLAWFEVFYNRLFEANDGALFFEAPDTTGYVRFVLHGFNSPSIYLFDVTDQFDIVELSGLSVASKGFDVTFFDTLSGYRRRYAALTGEAMLKPLDVSRVDITNIRYRPTKPYCVITHPDLVDAASVIADFHDGEVVTIDEIYNEFGWGLPDVTAIRDFIRWRYWHGPLGWVLLLGDGSWDLKGRRGRATYTNYVPSYERRYLPPFGDTYNTDDWFGYLEPTWQESLADFPSVAISRLPAISPDDAMALVQRSIEYQTNPELGMWQATAILIADDDRVGSSCDGIPHTNFAEQLSDEGLPAMFRQVKIYLTEYPPEATGLKTAAKNDFIENLNRGALLTNFVGHGDPYKLAQEEVYNPAAIGLVYTGPRRTFFIAASCNVSRFDDPVGTSMAEDLIHRAEGGTIGSLASTHLCKAVPNQVLNLNFLQQLFPPDFMEAEVTVGDAATIAKFLTIASAPNHDQYWMNSEMYALFGDPALVLAYPRFRISFDQSLPDTLKRRGIYGSHAFVMAGDEPVADFSGDFKVFLREAEDTSGYHACEGRFFDYELPGLQIFRGEGQVTGGELDFRFFVSATARRGPRGVVRCFAADDSRSALGFIDSLTISGEVAVSDKEGPEIDLVVGGRKIASGDTLLIGSRVDVYMVDSSGVAIKGISEIYPVSVAFDDDRINLGDSVVALNGDFTTSLVSFTVPSLSPGQHRLSVSAFDNLNNLTTREYQVFIGETVIEPSNVVYAYPNPANDFCYIVWEYETDGEVDIEVTIKTVTGRTIWRNRSQGSGPYQEIRWDCTDLAGDRVANGTYIAIVKAESPDDPGLKTSDKIIIVVMK